MGILQARIREWLDIPFSRVSSQPRDWTQVSRIAGRFFTLWATKMHSDCRKNILKIQLLLTCLKINYTLGNLHNIFLTLKKNRCAFWCVSSIKCESVSCSVMSKSLCPCGLQQAISLCPWSYPGKNTRVGYHSLLQGIFLTQVSNLSLLHCRQIFLPSEQPVKPFSLVKTFMFHRENNLIYALLYSKKIFNLMF